MPSRRSRNKTRLYNAISIVKSRIELTRRRLIKIAADRRIGDKLAEIIPDAMMPARGNKAAELASAYVMMPPRMKLTAGAANRRGETARRKEIQPASQSALNKGRWRVLIGAAAKEKRPNIACVGTKSASA